MIYAGTDMRDEDVKADLFFLLCHLSRELMEGVCQSHLLTVLFSFMMLLAKVVRDLSKLTSLHLLLSFWWLCQKFFEFYVTATKEVKVNRKTFADRITSS